MQNHIDVILSKIEAKNIKHAIKLRSNLKSMESEYFQLGNTFFKKYERYLKTENLKIDYAIDCYLKMIKDMFKERIKFIQKGRYSNSSFTDVEKNIYSNQEIISYHMHGLVLAQFLWFDQYERLKFFCDNLVKYFNNGKRYLEIGGGHGLYLSKAMNILSKNIQLDLVDISSESLNIAKGILSTDRINYFLKNIFDFNSRDIYDFITIGEVLEHLEYPLRLLIKIKKHLSKNGVCYVTTPINAPMIDHIYLFNNEYEIRELFNKAGFEVIEEKIVISEKISREKALKFKVPVMYAAFIKNK